MAVLFRAATMKKNLKQEFVMDRLRALGVSASQTGLPIENLNYEELKYELVLAEFRKIDSEKAENMWF